MWTHLSGYSRHTRFRYRFCCSQTLYSILVIILSFYPFTYRNVKRPCFYLRISCGATKIVLLLLIYYYYYGWILSERNVLTLKVQQVFLAVCDGAAGSRCSVGILCKYQVADLRRVCANGSMHYSPWLDSGVSRVRKMGGLRGGGLRLRLSRPSPPTRGFGERCKLPHWSPEAPAEVDFPAFWTPSNSNNYRTWNAVTHHHDQWNTERPTEWDASSDWYHRILSDNIRMGYCILHLQ